MQNGCHKFVSVVYSRWMSTVIVTARWFEYVHGTKFYPIALHQSIHYKSHTDELTTVLVHTEDNTNIKRLFYATVHP
jgi:hypothetical protein